MPFSGGGAWDSSPKSMSENNCNGMADGFSNAFDSSTSAEIGARIGAVRRGFEPTRPRSLRPLPPGRRRLRALLRGREDFDGFDDLKDL